MSPTSVDLIATLTREPGTLRRFLDTLGDAMFVIDRNQTIVFWNRQAEDLTGYPAADVLGRHCLAGIRCQNCLERCNLFEKGQIDKAEVELIARDGRRLQVEKSAFVLKDEEGTVIGGVELLRDRTALLQRMEECRLQRGEIETRERLKTAILGSIREGVVTIDPEWRITHFSGRAETLTGIQSADALGRFCHVVIGSSLCKNDCPALHCLEHEQPEASRLTRIRSHEGESLPIVETAVPLRDESGTVVGSVLLLEDRRLQAGLSPAESGAQLMGMIGLSAPMRQVFRLIEQVAPTDATVLITGESGTGKEMAARALHGLSPRRDQPFEAVNCAALPETLLESELFGHVRGAFTGAIKDRLGRIETAESGSLFLDEIGEMPATLQAKLLRFLQERDFQRVGESRTRRADVRILAATNRDLLQEIEAGRFRHDLYYRIKVIPLHLPPLRERSSDLPLLATRLLATISEDRGRSGLTFTPPALARLSAYAWPGNVRELVNVIEYAVALAPGRRIRAEDLPPELADQPIPRYRPESVIADDEAGRIRDALSRSNGNRSQAARALGMSRVTLYRKMKKYGLQ